MNKNTNIELFNESLCLSHEAIEAYVDGVLDEKNVLEANQHLSECELCTDAVEGWQMAEHEKAAVLLSEIQQEIKEKTENKRVTRRRIPTYARVGVAASLLILIGLFTNYQLGYFPFNPKLLSQNLDEWTFASLNIPPRPLPDMSLAVEEKAYSKLGREYSTDGTVDTKDQLLEGNTAKQEPILAIGEDDPNFNPSIIFEEEEIAVLDAEETGSEEMEVMERREKGAATGYQEALPAGEKNSDYALDNVSSDVGGAEVSVYREKLSNKKNKVYRSLEVEKSDEVIATATGEEQYDGLPIQSVEQPPLFISTNHKSIEDFIRAKIIYPESDDMKKGVVLVSFTIRKNGNISKPKIVRSLGEKYDDEALRLANLTDGMWKAGQENGKAVRVKYILPVRF